MIGARHRGEAGGASDPELVLRPADDQDVAACAAIWRDALNDYMGRLNLPAIPDEVAPIRRLHAHLHATDPERFWVAMPPAPADGAPRREPIAFAAAVQRDEVWFLSMLFVRAADQGRGLGRALLRRVLPPASAGPALATATDSAQPVSNALYAMHGIVPRIPLLSIVGRPQRAEALAPLPSGIRAQPFEALAGAGDADGHRRLVEEVDRLDRELLGFAHPQDHRFLRTENRRGFLYLAADGAVLGYGYASEVGRVGPVAVRDPDLVAPVLGDLLTRIVPRGASAVWVPGSAGAAVQTLLAAGLRLDGFPVLLCWSRPFADFARYLPISPGLL